MSGTTQALEFLKNEVENKEKRTVMNYDEWLELVRREPQRALRSIFQRFCDMVKSYVGEGKDEYPDDPESIGFVEYDCSKVFVEGADNPFFPGMLFANRFVRQIEALKQGSQQNRIYIYEGPQGCGKSTFLNNLLMAFEQYSDTKEGQTFEVFWDIKANERTLEVPCPSHDHPILLIPKNYRADFLKKLLSEGADEFKSKLFREKEYEWVFEREVCTICKSIFWALFDKLGDLDKALSMVKIRPYKFDRRLGEGISVFNPGDKPPKEAHLSDRRMQEKLDQVFGGNVIKYWFSRHARTNNGIYVLMDIKSNNEERLLELHNVISEGVHKVIDVEERVNSLFFALMNPEDKKKIEDFKVESFQGRIQYNIMRYVMDVPTEVNIYRSIFGQQTDKYFLPRVLDNFARVIISSRMNPDCKPLQEWIPNVAKYSKYCDESGLLLRMSIYGGIIPSWLSEEDKKRFTVPVRRKLIAEGENEGEKGLSGRDSIRLFSELFSRYGGKPNLISMSNVTDFFKHKIGRDRRDKYVPQNFIQSLVHWYDYAVLGEVKESLYFYNKDQIAEDILHYLCAVNYDIGAKVKCKFTGKDVEVTIEFLRLVGAYVLGREMSNKLALDYARDVQKRYAEILAQDRDAKITETELYKELFTAYVRNLKEKVLQPFLKNDNFCEAVKAFGTEAFETFDTRLKEHVAYMIGNLKNKFGYTEQGAKEICLYAIDQKLAEKFS